MNRIYPALILLSGLDAMSMTYQAGICT